MLSSSIDLSSYSVYLKTVVPIRQKVVGDAHPGVLPLFNGFHANPRFIFKKTILFYRAGNTHT